MNEALSPPENLEQLAPGVVLAGRYSLKERVPRWIAERRFRARDLESGDILAVLLWSSETAWFGELAQRLKAMPKPVCRDAAVHQGFGVVVLKWANGMRELEGSAGSAEEALRVIQASLSSQKRPVLPPRKPRNIETPLPLPRKAPARPLPEPAAPAGPGNPRLEWAGFALAAVVASVVIWLTLQLGRALSDPIVIEKEISVASPRPAATPTALDRELEDVVILLNNGNATSALQALVRLSAAHPNETRIQNGINALLNSLQTELPSIKAGFRPALRETIDQLAQSGNPAALRLSKQLASPEEPVTNSPQPLPIR